MTNLIVFDNISVDGYFCDQDGDMSWAHHEDAEWSAWTSENAGRGGVLLFGRVTYEMMASFWPTEEAKRMMPDVARGMTDARKIVFSRTMKDAAWSNTEIVSGDLALATRRLKAESSADLVVMGSGSVVAALAAAGLVDVFLLAVHPVALGRGRTLFEGVKRPIALKLQAERRFDNGAVVLTYCAASARAGAGDRAVPR